MKTFKMSYAYVLIGIGCAFAQPIAFCKHGESKDCLQRITTVVEESHIDPTICDNGMHYSKSLEGCVHDLEVTPEEDEHVNISASKILEIELAIDPEDAEDNDGEEYRDGSISNGCMEGQDKTEAGCKYTSSVGKPDEESPSDEFVYDRILGVECNEDKCFEIIREDDNDEDNDYRVLGSAESMGNEIFVEGKSEKVSGKLRTPEEISQNTNMKVPDYLD